MNGVGVRALRIAFILALLGVACAPEVGSEEWCDRLKEKPRGDWTANETADYARYCLVR